MSFNLYGKKPSSEEGEHFGSDIWWWRPLADYCIAVAPEVASNCKLWHSNHGGGLKQEDALALASRLEEEINSGRCAAYEADRADRMEAMPLEVCDLCEGTGIRKPVPQDDAGNEETGIPCNACRGSGWTESWDANYPFSVGNVQGFIAFLRECGGFEIW